MPMTNEKPQDNNSAKKVAPTSADKGKAESTSNFAKATQGRPAGSTAKDSGGNWWWLVFFLLVVALIAFVWFSWPQLGSRISVYLGFSPSTGNESRQVTDTSQTRQANTEQRAEEPTEKAPTTDGLSSQAHSESGFSQPAQTPRQPTTPYPNQQLIQLQQADASLRNQIQAQANTISELKQQLASMQRSITAQGNRLSELGNVSRQDWQLAEADYLLRMANQRLMLEDNSRAALGLVEKVDKILRQVNLPDLYGVRQQLAKDITALRLVENVDREGIYVRLRALEEQLIRANIQPEFTMTQAQEEEPKAEPAQVDQAPWERSWQRFTSFLRDSVRPIDGDINPVMLSPQSETRFRQTLRLNMEQAQLALLRGDSRVYKDALDSARELLLTYGTANAQRNALAEQLAELSRQPILAQMPDLNASQLALYNYIERLHKTSGQGGPALEETAQ
ncbi:hypothetical protein Misp06_01724 [Microbulbifer sp. NBRC 101763]|uniref:uroporphyrinogen-III C-methyltransferase n=1 Tax=Microbulbifer sp. NBRC 101763 TaxID=1113820 RepID=UPI0030AD408D